MRIVLALLLLVALSACPAAINPQTVAAQTIAAVANAAGVTLAAAMRGEGNAAIASSTTADEARARIDAIETRWAPVWAAYDALALAHDAYATALEAGTVPDAAEVARLYCALRAVAAGVAVSLPDNPAGACP